MTTWASNRGRSCGRCKAEDAEADHRAATGPLLDWYVHATDMATRRIRRFQVPALVDPNPPRSPEIAISDATGAFAWLDAKFRNLIAAVEVEAVEHRHAVQLPLLLQPYIRRGRFTEWLTAAHTGVRAA